MRHALRSMAVTLNFAYAEASHPDDLPGRVQALDWPAPRVCGLLMNTPWCIRDVHPAKLMHDVAIRFLGATVSSAPAENVLRGLVTAIEAALVELRDSAGKDDFDGLWDLGGSVALAATDGNTVCVARAGDVRVLAVNDEPPLIRRENTFHAEVEAQGISVEHLGKRVPEDVITAYVGGGQLPKDLICRVDAWDTRRLLFCALGAARGIHDDQLAVLGKRGGARSAAKAVLDERLGAATEQPRTMATCVVDMREGDSLND